MKEKIQLLIEMSSISWKKKKLNFLLYLKKKVSQILSLIGHSFNYFSKAIKKRRKEKKNRTFKTQFIGYSKTEEKGKKKKETVLMFLDLLEPICSLSKIFFLLYSL